MAKIIAIPDTHFPWADKQALKEVYKIIKKEKPDAIVHLGDLYDQYNFAKYPKNPNIMMPKDEFSEGLKDAQEFWEKINKISPNSKKYQLKGNHDMRRPKLLLNNAPQILSELNSMEQKYYTFDGVKSFESDREFIELDGVIYCHGWSTAATKHLGYFEKPVVRGHSHTADITVPKYVASNDKYAEYDLSRPKYEVAAGWLGDDNSPVFNYTPCEIHVAKKWRKGCVVVTDGIPSLRLL